jgi:hypothetical protein
MLPPLRAQREVQAVKRKIQVSAALAALAVTGLLIWSQWGSWTYHHPADWPHNCAMLAYDCPSHEAVWVPDGYAQSTYSRCACAATLVIHGSSR